MKSNSRRVNNYKNRVSYKTQKEINCYSLNILYVIPIFSPVHGGGAPVAVYNQIKELVKRGHNVTLYTTNYKINRKWGITSNAKIYEFNNIFKILEKNNIFFSPIMLKTIKKEITKFDVIYLSSGRTFQDIVISYYAQKYNIPYVFQAHGNLSHFYNKKRRFIYDNLLGNRIIKKASKVIALNKMEFNQYLNIGVKKENIIIIPNGMPLLDSSNLPNKNLFRKKYFINNNIQIILSLGVIHKIKRIDVLIKSYKYLIEKLNKTNSLLVIAGPDGGSLKDLYFLVKSLNLTHKILFTGPLYGRDKFEALVDCNIFVISSSYETFPMTLLEAYSCSKPVVASIVEGLKDLVLDGVTGLLFTSENFEQLGECLFYLLENYTEAEKMGKKGRQFMEENLTIEKIVDRLETLYTEIVESMRKKENYPMSLISI